MLSSLNFTGLAYSAARWGAMTALASMAYSTPLRTVALPSYASKGSYAQLSYNEDGRQSVRILQGVVASALLHILIDTGGDPSRFSLDQLSPIAIGSTAFDGLLLHRVYSKETDLSEAKGWNNADATILGETLGRIHGMNALVLLGVIHISIAAAPQLPPLRSWIKGANSL